MKRFTIVKLFFISLCPILLIFSNCSNGEPKSNPSLYNLNMPEQSRSISFENPTGAPGEGGKTASNLGVGRKGFPAKNIEAGETVVLCDIQGPGTIRHLWMTGSFKDNPLALRSMVIRGYWENQSHPGIECPLGDFMGLAHARVTSYQSAVHSVGLNAALNFWLPMPFEQQGRLTLSNEGNEPIGIFYQVDYTIGDTHPAQFGRLHVCFRRENPTTLTKDFEILPTRMGKGRFLGAVIGIRSLEDHWWGEGEIKIYMDGDTEFPTICGTGSEDYVGLSYGIQLTPFQYHGCNLDQGRFISMYRWHLLDPIYWKNSCRITIQQIGWSPVKRDETGHPLYERQDDWCAAAFWYESVPDAPLPAFPDLAARLANLEAISGK
jgi:hypothetical protein